MFVFKSFIDDFELNVNVKERPNMFESLESFDIKIIKNFYNLLMDYNTTFVKLNYTEILVVSRFFEAYFFLAVQMGGGFTVYENKFIRGVLTTEENFATEFNNLILGDTSLNYKFFILDFNNIDPNIIDDLNGFTQKTFLLFYLLCYSDRIL